MTDEVVIVGQGYVGLLLAVEVSGAAFDVTGLDIDESLVANLNAGRSHVGDVSDTQLKQAIHDGYRATTDPAALAGASVVVVCVPTPLGRDGTPDLTAVLAAADVLGRHLTGPATVILESTTHPGTTEEVFAPAVLRHGHRLDEDVFIAFSPERVDPGNRLFGIRNTPKVVGGLTPASTERARAFYTKFVDQVVTAKGAREAELAKILENTFRHVNIALVNEMLRVSNDLGVDFWDAVRCAETKPFGYMAFRPGPGVGGHCIPVDPMYIGHHVRAELGYPFRMVELAQEINRAAPLYVADRCRSLLNDVSLAVRGSRILLLGVTYKPGVADCRESPADVLAARLAHWGCEVTYHDPYVPRWCPRATGLAYDRVPDLDEALAAADLSVLLQPHPQYRLDHLAAGARRLLDTRGVVDPDAGAVTWL